MLTCVQWRHISLVILIICNGCYEPAEVSLPSICHPDEPRCASEDFDGDGVPNGRDDFPLDERCSQNDDQHCGRCDFSCGDGERCVEESRCTPVESERCDGEDNDLDQRIDEELSAPIASQTDGVCRGLSKYCSGEQGWVDPDYLLTPHYEEEESRCDGLDNDCDGRIDERLPTILSDSQDGVCAGSTVLCDGEFGWVQPNLSAIANYETNERSCDGVDNDCDGRMDEGLDGDRCDTGLLGRCSTGIIQCIEGVNECVSSENPAIERCDGFDNDCDGRIDEDVISPRTEGIGICAQLPQRCMGQEGWVAISLSEFELYQIIENRCDGLDNDCDGLVDEGYLIEACALNEEGPCAEGERRCVEGEVQCVPINLPESEVCDDLDNDCDGHVDESLQRPLNPNQEGVCEGLKMICSGSDGWVITSPQRLVQYEVTEQRCDGLDNDCDGFVDEASGSGTCTTGLLGRCAQGTEVCVNGLLNCISPSPTEERCDGIDNDCDGPADEDLISPVTSLFQGVCAGRIQICRGAQGWEDPSPVLLEYENPEVSCDGLDNDCDGEVDEQLIGPLALEQRGVCGGSSQQCIGVDGWVTPTLIELPNYEEVEQSCDGLDNDCDGQVDESLTPSSCATGQEGVCAIGTTHCIEGQVQCLPDIPLSNEQCDELDNDCDGVIDESLSGGPCAEGTGACIRQGQLRCIFGTYQCTAIAGSPQDERCDGVDNDCDESIDEDVINLGVTCSEGLGSCERTGVWQCLGGILDCSGEPGAATVERCDALDNDCDGLIDEDFPQIGLDCVIGVGECFRRSRYRCADSGELLCGDGPATASPERCDELDNDCDGRTDEHIQAELCDEVDNDCDGRIDEHIQAEICDGTDDDCDGIIDESPCQPCTPNCPILNWYSVSGGVFTFGGDRPDEVPQLEVSIPNIQLTQEITVGQYTACVDQGVCPEALVGGDCNMGRPDRVDHPINCITWNQANLFAQWIGARLPSETQWEYVARDRGLNRLYTWGGEPLSCARAHINETDKLGCDVGSTASVCSYPLGNNSDELCDLMGNVWEWVRDDYQSDYFNTPLDGSPLCENELCTPQNLKVYRGGGWRVDPIQVDTRRRGYSVHTFRSSELGFRLLRFGQ